MRLCTYCLLPIVLFAATVADAAEAFDPAARARVVAPLIGETTLAVIHLDCTRIEAEPLLDLLAKLVPGARESADMAEARKGLPKLRDSFVQDGSKDFYVLADLDDMDLPDGGLLFVVPLQGGERQSNLENFIKDLISDRLTMETLFITAEQETVTQTGDRGRLVSHVVLLIGYPESIARAKKLPRDPRPELAAAFEAAGDTAAQAVLIPPRHTARVIDEMVGSIGELVADLPPQIADTPSSVVTNGLLWAAAGADLQPEPTLRLVVQSKDEEAADTLREKLIAILEFFGSMEPVREIMPKIDTLASLLTPTLQGSRLVVSLDAENHGIDKMVSLLAPSLEEARQQAMQTVSIHYLRQLGLLMHMHHAGTGAFPASASYDADGKPLLSWRVHVLPYMEENELYEQFHLDEPWDSEHNRTLIDKMPFLYKCPSSKVENGRTVYLVPVGEETVFPPGHNGISMKEIKDGTAATILLVEADDEHAVVWTKPDDLPFDPDDPARGLGQAAQGGFNAAYCDGHVQFLVLPQDPNTLRALFTRAAGDGDRR